MFKFPGTPCQNHTSSELADFAEWRAWQEGSLSTQTLQTDLGRSNENHFHGGSGDEDDANENLVNEVMTVVARREKACNGAYPFRVEEAGCLLRRIEERFEPRAYIYLYLLLCTRLNMQENRTLANQDGTALFEKLTAHVLLNYLGGGRARSLVFGTSTPGAFKEKINNLCQELGEGGACRSPSADRPLPSGGDGKLDVVAWVPFHDQRSGKLILFAQSKTGTHWRDEMPQLQPLAFMSKWLRNNLLPEPVRVFCVAEAVDTRWQETQIDGGILLDRCRMVDFADEVPPETLEGIRAWTGAGEARLRTL